MILSRIYKSELHTNNLKNGQDMKEAVQGRGKANGCDWKDAQSPGVTREMQSKTAAQYCFTSTQMGKQQRLKL